MSGQVSAAAAEVVMTGGELAALIAAVAFAVLALVLAYVILGLRKTIKAATMAINDANARTGPLLNNVNTTVDHVNSALTQVHTSLDGVNVQLERVDSITGHAQQVTGNVANVTTLVSAAATNPLVKLAAFGFGVRRASAKRRHDETERDIRNVMAADKKPRKKRGRHQSEG